MNIFTNIRKFHNKIKYSILKNYAQNSNKLLDLACGKGGDLLKYKTLHIKQVNNYDINQESILEAKKRFKNLHIKKRWSFTVMDLSTNALSSPKIRYDVISCMFAFHYFFQNHKTFNTILKTINNNIKKNGYFIGTIFDNKKLKDWKLNNDHFYIKWHKRTNSLFGNEIEVYMEDSVLNTPTIEYIIDFDKFVGIMEKHGYTLIESYTFNNLWFLEPTPLSSYEQQISYLNRYFVFQKL